MKDFMSTQTGGEGQTLQMSPSSSQLPSDFEVNIPPVNVEAPSAPQPQLQPADSVEAPITKKEVINEVVDNKIAQSIDNSIAKSIENPVSQPTGNNNSIEDELRNVPTYESLFAEDNSLANVPLIPISEQPLPDTIDGLSAWVKPAEEVSPMDLSEQFFPETIDGLSPYMTQEDKQAEIDRETDINTDKTKEKYRDAGYDIQSDLYGNIKALKLPTLPLGMSREEFVKQTKEYTDKGFDVKSDAFGNLTFTKENERTKTLQEPKAKDIEEKIYSFPGREDMEYTVQNEDWKIRKKGTDEWQTIKETARIKALNKEHGLAVNTQLRRGGKEVFIGESGRQYQLDYTGEVPVWKTYGSKLPSQKTSVNKDYLKTPDILVKEESIILDPKTVNLLNKKFGQQASTSSQEQIYTGFPDKEENQYRESGGYWQRKQPNATKWTTITDKVATEALNKQFKKDVVYNAGRDKYAKYTTDVAVDEKEALKNELKSINSSLIGKETSEVKAILKEQFGDNGFEFYGGGSLVDEIKVVAPNGKYKWISLDNFKDEDDLSESINLKSFIELNSNKELNKSKEELDKAKNLTTKSGFDVELGYADRFGNQAETKVTFTSPQEAYKNKLVQKDTREKYVQQNAKQVNDVYELYRESMKVDSKVSDKEVTAAYANLPNDTEQIQVANAYADDILNSSNSIKKEIDELGVFAKDIQSKIESGEITKDDYNANYKKQISDKSAELQSKAKTIQSQYSNLTNINQSIDKSIADNYIVQEAKGSIGGGIGYKFTKGLTSIARLGVNLTGGNMTSKDNDDLVRSIVGHGTSEEYMGSENRGDLSKTLFSLSESLGALLATAVIPGAGVGKAGLLTQAGRVALVKQIPSHIPFYALGYYEMRDELDKIEGISEAEKVLMSSFYGVGSSVLEKYGLNKAMSKTPIGSNLRNNVLGAVFKDIPKGASKEVIESLIDKSIKKKLVEAGVTTIEAMTVEGITEMSQAGLQMGIKEVYDQAKKTKYFNNDSGLELVGQLLKEGYLGALGGGIMHTVSQSPSILKNGIRNTLNKEQIEVIDNVSQSEDTLEALAANVKIRIASGEISDKEGQNIIESYNVIKTTLETIPNDLSIETKAEALDLVLEKQKLQEEIVGKDEALIGGKLERIKEINNSLAELSKTKADDTKNEAGVSGEVAKGEESIQTEPIVGTSQEALSPSGVVQETPTEVTPTTVKAASLEEAKALWEQGYRPVLNGQVQKGNQVGLEAMFNTMPSVEMQKEAPSTEMISAPLTAEETAGKEEIESSTGIITTKNPIKILKGLFGKRNADGSVRTAHPDVKGTWGALDENIAKRYKGDEEKTLTEFSIPAGTTVETIEIPDTNIPVSELRQAETDAVNNSTAQVVRLITMDSGSSKKESQIIIKDANLSKVTEAAAPTIETWQDKIDKPMTNEELNAFRTSLRNKFPNSYATEILDLVAEARKGEVNNLPYELDNLADEITINDIGNLLAQDELFETRRELNAYLRDRATSGDILNATKESKEETKIEEKFQSLADKIREGKIGKDGMAMSSIPGFKEAWNISLEIVAKAVEGGASIADAISQGFDEMQKSKWYVNLTKEQKTQAFTDYDKAINERAAKKRISKAERDAAKEFKGKVDEATGTAKKPKTVNLTEYQALVNSLKDRNDGGKAALKALKDIKAEIEAYAKANLPTDLYSKRELLAVAASLRMATSSNLDTVIEKIDTLVAKKQAQRIAAKAKAIKEKINSKKTTLAKKGPTKWVGKGTIDSQEEYKDFISQIDVDSLGQRTEEELDAISDVIDGILSNGVADRNILLQAEAKAKRERAAGLLIGLGAKGEKLSDFESIQSYLDDNPGSVVVINGELYTKSSFKEFAKNNNLISKKEDRLAVLSETLDELYIASQERANEIMLSNPTVEEYYAAMDADKTHKSILAKIAKTVEAIEKVEQEKGDIVPSENIIGDALGFKYQSVNVSKESNKNASNNPFIRAGKKVGRYFDPLRHMNDVYALLKAAGSKNSFVYKFVKDKISLPISDAFFNRDENYRAIIAKYNEGLDAIFGTNPLTSSGSVGINRLAKSPGSASTFLNGDLAKDFPIANGHIVDWYNLSLTQNGEERLTKSNVNVKAVQNYMALPQNADLKKYSDLIMQTYKDLGIRYAPTYESVTNTKFPESIYPYYPSYSESYSADAINEESMLENDGTFKSMDALSKNMKQRTDFSGPLNVQLDAHSKIMDYVKTMEHAKEFIPIARSVNELFSRENSPYLVKTMGERNYNDLRTHLSVILSGNPVPGFSGATSKVMGKILNLQVISTLGAKPISLVKQFTSFTHYWAAGIDQGLNPLLIMGGVPTTKDEFDMYKSILKSSYVKQRYSGDGLDYELRRIEQNKGKNRANKALSVAAKTSMTSVRLGDVSVIIGPGGGAMYAVALYRKFRSQGMSHAEAKKKAYMGFVKETEASQQSSRDDVMSNVQRDPAFRMIATYRTGQMAATKKIVNGLKTLGNAAAIQNKEGIEARRDAIPDAEIVQAITDITYFTLLSSIFFSAVASGAIIAYNSGNYSDEEKKRILYDLKADQVGSVLQGLGISGFLLDWAYNVARGDDWKNNVPVIKKMGEISELVGTIPELMTREFKDLEKADKDVLTQGEMGQETFRYDDDLAKREQLIKEFNDAAFFNKMTDAEKAAAVKAIGGGNISTLIENFNEVSKGEKSVFDAIMNYDENYFDKAIKQNKKDYIYEYLYGEPYLEKGEDFTPVKLIGGSEIRDAIPKTQLVRPSSKGTNVTNETKPKSIFE